MSNPHATGFMVLHSNQLEGLRDLAVQFMRHHPLPVLTPEVLLVQSNGMKHWLELALAQHLGICAATQVELPSAKLWQIYRAVLGPSRVPAHMPLDKSPLVWRILRRLPELLTQARFAPLANYLGRDVLNDRRAYQLATQLADVLDGYQNYRADWLDDWARGHDHLARPTGAAEPLPALQSWQPALWRDLLQDLRADSTVPALAPAALPHAYRSRAEVHAAFLQALTQLPEGQRPDGVPPRLMVFGVSSLPTQTVQALAALGRVCQVLMFVQNPCQHYTLHTDTHPLLAAWGKQGRDYLHLLEGFDDVAHDSAAVPFQRVDVFVDPVQSASDAGRAPTQLEQLQSAMLSLEPVPSTPSELAREDDSISMVQTHGAQREVEVLHDRILAWLDADDSLKPRDIMVMVPDMAAFAPHIHAVFGRFAPREARHVPYTVADTTPRTEPLVQALDTLLQLPQLRITRAEWQGLFEVAAVRQRFGLDEHDVAQLDEWLSRAGVRWGLDAQQRQAWGLAPDLPDGNQNSWLFGLERLLLGYATLGYATRGYATDPTHENEAAPWRNTLPQPGIAGLDARVVEGLLQWLRHTLWALHTLRQSQTPTQWVAVLQQLVARFFKPCGETDERLIERVMAPLETWLAECQLASFEATLPLAVVREHWLAQLEQPAMQRRFFGAGVQFATLMPMRSIPFRVVCLLGMNDGDYPRSQPARDFDLMRQAVHASSAGSHWRAGDRSRREDDRYLFLEALLSARDKLYISWQGRRSTDHEVKPASVLVAQLMDYLNATWTRNGQPACVAPLQPLHAFSSKYFTQGSGFVTYAQDWQVALGTPAVALSPLAVDAGAPDLSTLASPPTPAVPMPLTLQHLHRLLKQPVEVFLIDHLRLRLDQPPPATEEEEPFSLSGLAKYKLNQIMAQADDATQALMQLRLSGQLAWAGFGEMQEQVLRQDRRTLRDPLDGLLPHWPHALGVQSAHWQFGPTQICQLNAEWANAAGLWRSNLHHTEWLQVALHPGAVTEGHKSTPQPRLDTLSHLWLHHLAACASGTPTTSVQIGLDAAITLKPLSAEAAQAELHRLCEIYVEAWAQPLPVAAKAACAYWMAHQALHPDPLEPARTRFIGTPRRQGEYPQSAALQRVFSGFDDIADSLPLWAERLYAPLLQAAHLTHLAAPASDDAKACA